MWNFSISSRMDSATSMARYVQAHPEQAALMRSFGAKVASPALALDLRQNTPVKIAAIYPGLQQSDYWRRNMRAFSYRLDKLSISYRLDEHRFTPTTPLELQQQAISAALKKDPDYLILTLDDFSQRRLIENLLARQRPKIILLNITTPLKDWAAHQPFFYAGFDHVEGSRMLADALFDQSLSKPSSIGVLYRQSGYVSRMRGGSFINAMRQAGIPLNAAYYTQADAESGRLATLQLLDQANIPDFIYACSTDLALGAIQALKQRGLQDKVKVNGWGGGSTELAAIRRGELALTVMRMNDDTGIAMAEAISNDLREQPVPQIYAGRFAIVTQQHSQDQIQLLSDTAFRYSNR